MAYHTLRLEFDPPLARIRLARPERGNPIDMAFIQELGSACTAINDDQQVRVAILTAEGGVFSTGWDPAELAPEGPIVALLAGQHGFREPFAPLVEMAQPVIAAINGNAVSAGLELALACDIRLAAEGARFALPETGQGFIPMGGGTQRLARLVGRGRALELIMTAVEIDAQEAWRIGLVSAVIPRDRLLAEVEALAGRIAARGPIAVRYAKEAVWRGLEMPLDQALRFETDLTIILQTTEDRDEGVRAFLEKRSPRFRGR